MNYQLCLWNCDNTSLVVGGVPVPFTDGATSAFEDRMFHQIINDGDAPRVSLAVGVLHPSLPAADVSMFSGYGARLT